jgi:hypothetical protein
MAQTTKPVGPSDALGIGRAFVPAQVWILSRKWQIPQIIARPINAPLNWAHVSDINCYFTGGRIGINNASAARGDVTLARRYCWKRLGCLLQYSKNLVRSDRRVRFVRSAATPAT